MAIHLLVVAQHDPSSPKYAAIEPAARLVHDNQTDTFVLARCRSPRELIMKAREVALKKRQLIDVLDIYDHAEPGIQQLGDGILFDYRGTGRFIARALRPLLTPDARVRLLGCETALFEHGQQLLLMLRQELGGSVAVYGTIDIVEADGGKVHEFDETGFKKVLEDGFLFSSTEAMTRLAPSSSTRGQEFLEWLASQSPNMGENTVSRS